MTMTAEQLAQLRGQSVEGSFYLAECGHCGEMYPSNKLTGGEPLFSGDYGECYCPLCGAEDTDIADCGAWGSEAVTAWNYQQKRVEALLDELERKDKRIAKLEAISSAAEKLVRCKGRYHSEQNYRALAALFGVTTPDLPPLESEARTVTVSFTPIPMSELGNTSDGAKHPYMFGAGYNSAVVHCGSELQQACARAGVTLNLTVEG